MMPQFTVQKLQRHTASFCLHLHASGCTGIGLSQSSSLRAGTPAGFDLYIFSHSSLWG